MDLQNINVEKKPTNTISKFVYGAVLALWIFTSIYAFSFGNLNDTQRTEDSILGSNKIFQVLHKNRLEFVFKAFVCAFFSLLFIWALKFVKPLFFYFAIGCFSVLMLSGFFLAFTNFGYILNLTLTLPLAFLYTLIFLTVLYALKNVGIDSVCKTIRDSCKAILFYRESVTIVIVFQCLLIVASVLFLATDLLLTSLEPSHFHYLLHLVNRIGFLWTFLLIKDLVNLVLSSAFYAWHQNQEKMLLSPSDVHDKVLITLKTYFGTACYGSSIMSIFCQLSTIITTSIRMIRDESYKKAHPVICLATIYLIVLPNIFTSITYPMTVLYGYDFFESTKKAYDLVIKKTLKFLTSTFIPQLTAFIGCVFIIIALIISHYTNALFGASSEGYKNEEEMYRMKIILSFNLLTIVLPLFYVLYTAACSITMYSLENEKIRDTYENTSSA